MKIASTFFAVALCVCSAHTFAKDVKMGFGLTLPPYVIAERNTGFELEIIKEAMSRTQLQV